MVNLDIPECYTHSPSSGTPHLTINRDAVVDLDSSNAFEGPEKLLELWFCPSPGTLPNTTAPSGLKAVPADEWKEMLDLVNCKVLSIVESEDVDAYLLSESSMFVFPHKLILKTCGTTTLLHGLPKMLELAALSARFPHAAANPLVGIPAAATPYRVFYSRKNFLFPDKQRAPHRSWRDEVRYLDKMFLGGSAYMVGKMNGEHWYLYLTGPDTELTPPSTPDESRTNSAETKTTMLQLPPENVAACLNGSGIDEAQDETLEILMTDLDPENAKQFHLDNASAIAEEQYYQTVKYGSPVLESTAGSTEGINPKKSNGHGDSNVSKQGDDFDVFSNTSSDNSELAANDEDGYPDYPEELTTEGHALGSVVSNACGLSDVYPAAKYPEARIDAYLFTPCGFSANGVIPAPAADKGITATHYFTVHVTPEPHCSYASFETNVPERQSGRETAEVVEQVVGIFRPGRFSVTLFEATATADEVGVANGAGYSKRDGGASTAKRSARMESIKGYRRIDRIVHDLDGYDLVFRYYERDDWKGGAPRIGEIRF
ncbi:MAG: spermidine resistance protein [Piccolia ochrophora]|nr:MAG: spermidine resistance protein [Piccolia ochrophora]